MNLKKVLENYGLSKKQASLYLACLEMDSASVYKISQKAKLPRSTCYEVLESLRGIGLVTTFRKKNVIYYSAEDPKIIINNTKEKIKDLEKALPEFLAMFGSSKTQPTVRFYLGKSGMKIILEEILNEADEIKGFSSTELFNVLGDYWPNVIAKRTRKKIPAKILLEDSSKAEERKRLGPKELREVKIYPKKFKHSGIIMIWKNKIAMFSFKKDLMALIIESEELAYTQKMMFNYIWESIE